MSPPTSKTIAFHLKELRKAQKLSVGQVCQYLAENGYQVAVKTLLFTVKIMFKKSRSHSTVSALF